MPRPAWLPSVADIKLRLMALWLLFHHPDTPWPPKVVALLLLGYALSPIDLIPDFIPVLGQLDEALILPLGLWLVVRLVPPALWDHCLAQARGAAGQRPPRWRWAAVVVVLVWVASAGALAAWWWAG